MIDFLTRNFSIINDIPLFIAALTGVFVYKSYKGTPVKYFIWFLVYVFMVDFIGGYSGYANKYEFLASFKMLLKDTVFEKNIGGILSFGLLQTLFLYHFIFLKF